MESKEAAKLEYKNGHSTDIKMKGSNTSHNQRQKLQKETARESESPEDLCYLWLC